MDGMDALREAVEQAFANYRKGLVALIVKTLTELAAKDPQATYGYSSGMGTWYFSRDGKVTEEGETFDQEDDDYEPAFSAVQTAESDYGDSAVPTGMFKIRGKKVLMSDLD